MHGVPVGHLRQVFKCEHGYRKRNMGKSGRVHGAGVSGARQGRKNKQCACWWSGEDAIEDGRGGLHLGTCPWHVLSSK
jgi:hypothetical protein